MSRVSDVDVKEQLDFLRGRETFLTDSAYLYLRALDELLSARKVLKTLGMEGEPGRENLIWGQDTLARFDAHLALFPEEE